MGELLPCPFCGSTASISTGKKGDGSPWDYIECDGLGCGAIAEPDAWNCRVTVAQASVIRSAWTPDQFWEYVEGLTDPLTRDQIRDMLGWQGLVLSSGDQK